MFLDSFEEVDQWILLLSRNGVRELVLSNSNRCYHLPSCMFSCLELTKLKLDNCFFKPPLEFIQFLHLEELVLWNIDFGANWGGTQISLPQLKKLWLYTCTNVYNFNIKATQLWNLTVSACPDAMLLRLLDSLCVLAVWITLDKPIQDFVRVEKLNLTEMLSKLPGLKYLFIDSHFLKFLIADTIPYLLPNPISSLRFLWLLHFQLGDLEQLHGALCFLRNSPNLIKLSIKQSEEPRVDVGPALNHLESPNCLDCTLNQLQSVKIKYLQGSEPEMLFIKLLLANSPSLEKFTIRPSGANDVQKRLDIAKDVMQFPRASPKAKMFYLNPKR